EIASRRQASFAKLLQSSAARANPLAPTVKTKASNDSTNFNAGVRDADIRFPIAVASVPAACLRPDAKGRSPPGEASASATCHGPDIGRLLSGRYQRARPNRPSVR